MKTHKFDVEDAKKYGVEKAILLEHLKFHQQANRGNDGMVINGKVHAFIKPSTIKEMYPYLNYASVRRWLKELEDEGVIESCKPKAKGGYHLKWYHVRANDQNDQSNDQDNQSLNDQNDQSSIITNVNTNNDNRKEKIYQLYPRHVGKKKALKKIEKALEDITFDELRDIVKRYAKSVEDKERQYIPYPATWFNQGRYLDDPKEWTDHKENETGLGDKSKLRRVNM